MKIAEPYIILIIMPTIVDYNISIYCAKRYVILPRVGLVYGRNALDNKIVVYMLTKITLV